MLLFQLLFSTDLCVLEVMMDQLSMDNVVATQKSASENELVSISGQLPSELVAQIPSVVVENSSDVHIGPHLQYKDAVANKQYITVKGKGDIGSLAERPSKNTETNTVHPPEGAIPVGMFTGVFCMLAWMVKAMLSVSTPYRYIGGTVVYVHESCTLALDGSQMSASHPGRNPWGNIYQ